MKGSTSGKDGAFLYFIGGIINFVILVGIWGSFVLFENIWITVGISVAVLAGWIAVVVLRRKRKPKEYVRDENDPWG